MNIKDKLDLLNEEIEKTLIKAGRSDDLVNLVAVTKTKGIDIIKESLKFGVTDIGENRVQELSDKYDELGKDVNFHMIGHLQTNKVRNLIGKTKLIHSLDRMSLAQELNKRSKMLNITTDVLLQVNIAEEKSKHGLKSDEVLQFLEDILDFQNIRIKGLMTMAPLTEDQVLVRNVFRSLFKIKEDIVNRNYKGLNMAYLSMGMTNDYKLAIEEGSNMIRIGSFIFGERNY
ncbi:MAG: YggS family pyridoxal phosphate-dependent enzyme [Tissierellaceae bacterium]|nr:YggS family pyridoxal phosphate-dependent enzyme [Tissierellaceae bacterium]